MLTLERPNKPQQSSVTIDRLLVEETQGVTQKDKLMLFCLKKIYLASRVSSILTRKKNEDLPYGEGGTSFKNFLYKSVKFLGKMTCLNLAFKSIVEMKMSSMIL
jgi:hypothetical protein